MLVTAGTFFAARSPSPAPASLNLGLSTLPQIVSSTPLQLFLVAAPQSPQLIDFPVLSDDAPSTLAIECFGSRQIGLADLGGNLLIPQCFDSITPFVEGLAQVNVGAADVGAPAMNNVSGHIRYGFINPQRKRKCFFLCNIFPHNYQLLIINSLIQ